MNIPEILEKNNQTNLLSHWKALDDNQKKSLESQLEKIDLSEIQALLEAKKSQSASTQAVNVKITPPKTVINQPRNDTDITTWYQAEEKGKKLIADGKVACVLVAGGQGSRLGFPHPKGMFPIGPVSNCTLFQIFFEQLTARQNELNTTIQYAIMTSQATHQPTLDFFEKTNYFGLDRANVTLFQQGTMPAVDDQTGQLLLKDAESLCLSPDGHGGIIQAMDSSGLLKKWNEDGVEYLFYHQVDNPTAIVCDPALIGLHVLNDSEMTTKVARKRSADERMGVLAEVNDVTGIIEYSDMSDELAQQTDENGDLSFWAGNMAVHVFSRDFLERLTQVGTTLPFHIAHKKVPHIDAQGNQVDPETPNAFKFERFIFDALEFAKNPLVVEANRQAEFNPVKNAEGSDSPATAKAAIIALHKQWLLNVGVKVPEGKIVEISPLFAHDEKALQNKKESIPPINSDSVFIK